MMTAVALDDEPIALEVVKSLSEKVPFLELKACFTDAFQAIDYLQNNKVDLLLLDIKMPDISGLELLKSLTQPPLVIFTTAYAEHAVQSFELDAIDYLLKPFSLSRFLKACNKAHELVQLRSNKDFSSPVIFVKSGYDQVRVSLQDILFVESAGNYMQFITPLSKILSRLTMVECQALLPPAQFFRIHRSYIVNRLRIDRIEKTQVWVGDYCVPVGAGYAQALEQIVGTRGSV
jgi:DNA-binding LytR/AlgR family response regulator